MHDASPALAFSVHARCSCFLGTVKYDKLCRAYSALLSYAESRLNVMLLIFLINAVLSRCFTG